MDLTRVDAVVADLDELISLLVGLPQGPRSHSVHFEQLEAAMSVAAKFYVQSVEKTEGSSTASKITLGAVCRGIENSGWASATPAGNIVLWSLNDAATEQFVQGEEYLIHFTRSPKPAPGDGHKPDPVKTKYGSIVCATCGGTPSWDTTKYDWSTVTVDAVDWTQHDAVFSPTP